MTEERGVVKYEARDGQQVTLSFETIKRYLVQGHSEMVTQQELMFFMGICKSKGLNPFNKDCYLIKYSPKQGAAIITAVDYFRKRAKAQRDCHGWQKGIILDRDGKIVYSKGLMLEDDILLGGWFKAQPEGWTDPFELEVNLKGYIKKKSDGSITTFWQKENQPTQIAKVAESQGLRTLWPDEFQQLYTPEEMGQPEVFSQAEGIITDKTSEEALTEKIKLTPEYAAQDLKAKLDAGDQEVKGYRAMTDEASEPPALGQREQEEEPDPTPLEQGEPEGILPDGVDALSWLVPCRPTSSVANAKSYLKVFEEQESEINMLSDRKMRDRLIAKQKLAKSYLAAKEPENVVPAQTEAQAAGITPERLEFEETMRTYMGRDEQEKKTRYQDKLNDLGYLTMADVKVSDEVVVLGFMAEEFSE